MKPLSLKVFASFLPGPSSSPWTPPVPGRRRRCAASHPAGRDGQARTLPTFRRQGRPAWSGGRGSFLYIWTASAGRYGLEGWPPAPSGARSRGTLCRGIVNGLGSKPSAGARTRADRQLAHLTLRREGGGRVLLEEEGRRTERSVPHRPDRGSGARVRDSVRPQSVLWGGSEVAALDGDGTPGRFTR